MSLPYRWYPLGIRHDVAAIVVGDLIAHEHAVWRVVEIRPLPETDWTPEDHQAVQAITHYADHYRETYAAKALPRVMRLRPISAGDDVRDRDNDKHYILGGRATNRLWRWNVYPDEHYPVCAQCHEPLPCRDQMAVKVSSQAMERMTRYETAGVCPSCKEIVSVRQQSVTYRENVMIPGGPPLTFHLRRACRSTLLDYEKHWVADDPTRKAQFTCPGDVTNHNDGTYECTALQECPGPNARHRAYSVCDCVDCHSRGLFGCTPAPSARNVSGGAS